ncbi:MAG: NAD(P)/FAD-dependent oxidoreductase [Bacteroides sp.]|nr:NAD(P)/FAD-dependent oxidoreductase [Bacteroides sp.]
MKKVIIIGSGLGGLSSGVILAKNGYDVTILEQGAQIGGCLQCFYRHGVKFETGMHFIGCADEGQILYKMLRYLEVSDKLSLSRLDTNRYNVISLEGQHFNFANGKEAFIQQMAAYFPTQADNIRKYCEIVESISAASSLHTLKYGETDNAVNMKYQLRSINDVVEHVVTDPLLQKVLVGDLPLYAAERDKTPFSVHAFIMDFYNQSSFRFVGGSDSVVNAFIEVLHTYGGKVRKRSKVTRIVCNSTHATGVEVNGEEMLEADYIISSTHPMRTIEMLGPTNLIRPAFRNRIKSLPQTVGGFSVYLHFKENTVPYMNYNFFGYNTDTPWGCEQYDNVSWPKGYLYMHICDRSEEKFARSGVILSYMQIEEMERWKHTTIGHRGIDYEAFVNERAQRLIDSLNQQFPGIKERIAHFYVSSPLTYRDYTGTEDGSLYGVAKDVSLNYAGRVPHKTRIPNVFMTGQNINSHGMLGVIVGSIVTCGELLTPKFMYEQIVEANQ